MNSTNAFLISQLRAKSTHKSIEAIAVFILVFFVLALLPQILVRYVYAGQLQEEPQLFQVLQVAGSLIGLGYFLFVVVSNLQREMEAKRLEKVMMADSWTPGAGNSDSVSALQEAMAGLESSVSTPAAPKARRGRPSRKRV